MNEAVEESRIHTRQRCPDGLAPPVETLDLARGLLAAHHAEQVAKRYRQRVEMARYQDRARELALAHARHKRAERQHLEQEWRALVEQRVKAIERIGQRGTPVFQDVEHFPRAGLTIAAPPYDFDWVAGSGGRGVERANRLTGKYDLRVQSLGDGTQSVAAGLGFWFFSGDGNPAQRFAALVDYAHVWFASASFYVADSRQQTRLWVFGATEKAWVAQSDVAPAWSDHVGWLDSSGNDPEGEEGRVSNETFFPAAPNSWYQCWIWSAAEVYADSGFWGFAAASAGVNISVPFAVVGGL